MKNRYDAVVSRLCASASFHLPIPIKRLLVWVGFLSSVLAGGHLNAAEDMPKSQGWKIPARNHAFNSVSPNGRWGLFTEQQGAGLSVKIYDLRRGGDAPFLDNWDKAFNNMQGHEFGLIWSADDKFAYWNGQGVTVYSLAKKAPITLLPVSSRFSTDGPARMAKIADFTPDGSRVVFVCDLPGKASIEVWNIEAKRMEKTFDVTRVSPRQIAISPDGLVIYSLSPLGSNTLIARSIESGEVLRSLDIPRDWLPKGTNMKVSPDGKHIALYGTDGIKLLRATDFELQSSIGLDDGLVVPPRTLFQVLFTPDSKRLVTGTTGLPVWNLAEGKLEGILGKVPGELTKLTISEKGGYVGAFEVGVPQTLNWHKLTAMADAKPLLAFKDGFKEYLAKSKSGRPPAASNTATSGVKSVPQVSPPVAKAQPPPAGILPQSTPVPVDPAKEAEKAFAEGHRYYIWVDQERVHEGQGGDFLYLLGVTLQVKTAPGVKNHSYRARSAILLKYEDREKLSGEYYSLERETKMGEKVSFVIAGGKQKLSGKGLAMLQLVEGRGDLAKAKPLSNTVFVTIEFK